MKVVCPSCGEQFDTKHPHLTYDGFVPVRMNRKRKFSLFVRREDLEGQVADSLLFLQHENDVLRSKLGAARSLIAQSEEE